MIMLLLTFLVLLSTSIVSCIAWRKERRREKARSLLRDDAAAGSRLSGLLSVMHGLASGPPSRPRSILLNAAAVLVVLALTHNPFIAFLAWPASVLARRQLERHRRRRTRTKKEEQVLELVDSLSQSLRSGLSLQQSLEVALDDIGEELAEEVSGVLKDVRMGNGLEEALTGAAGRAHSPTLRLTFTVLGLLHGKGGDLPRILERLRKRVAEGLEVRREARILTSQSRASGYLVASLPPVFLLLQAVLNPRSLSPLFATPTGNLIMAAAIALNAAAFLIIRKMVNPEV
jgi:tight adherence protein B